MISAIEEIEQDLNWREAEIAILRIMLSNRDLPDREKLVLFRAAWALLYAHYEGFCKFALTVFYDSLGRSGLRCRHLPERTIALALDKKIKQIKSLPSFEFFKEIVFFQATHLEAEVEFPDVETDSNLWPRTLDGLLRDADISISSLQLHNRKLATLVSRRNKIAHGEREIITDLRYYLDYEDAVTTLMCDLAIAIDEKLTSILQPVAVGATNDG